MRISKNQKNYIPLINPVDKPFERLIKSEAKAYFDWFIGHVDERSEYIRQKVSKDLNISVELIDFSFESLIYIWRWFLNIVELNRTPKIALDIIRNELKANGEKKNLLMI